MAMGHGFSQMHADRNEKGSATDSHRQSLYVAGSTKDSDHVICLWMSVWVCG